MSAWKIGNPRQILADLRVAGPVLGRSGVLPKLLRLHKTDLISDIRKLPDDHSLTWQIVGNPEETGRYAPNRRKVVIWLGFVK